MSLQYVTNTTVTLQCCTHCCNINRINLHCSKLVKYWFIKPKNLFELYDLSYNNLINMTKFLLL